MPLGSQHGPQNPLKTLPTSTQNRSKIDVKIDENFDCILRGFLVALGANMAPKPSQKPLPRGGVLSPLLTLGGLLGGSWGLLGPKSQFYRFLIDFWSIFVDFCSIFGRFLVDFWTIFIEFWSILAVKLCTSFEPKCPPTVHIPQSFMYCKNYIKEWWNVNSPQKQHAMLWIKNTCMSNMLTTRSYDYMHHTKLVNVFLSIWNGFLLISHRYLFDL